MITATNENPSIYYGGTWEAFGIGRTLVGFDSSQTEFNAVEKTGGEKTHLLTQNESGLREHTHPMPLSQDAGVAGMKDAPYRAVWSSTRTDESFRTGRITGINTNTNDYGSAYVSGTGDANALYPHNNLQPYIVVYFWKKTAN